LPGTFTNFSLKENKAEVKPEKKPDIKTVELKPIPDDKEMKSPDYERRTVEDANDEDEVNYVIWDKNEENKPQKEKVIENNNQDNLHKSNSVDDLNPHVQIHSENSQGKENVNENPKDNNIESVYLTNEEANEFQEHSNKEYLETNKTQEKHSEPKLDNDEANQSKKYENNKEIDNVQHHSNYEQAFHAEDKPSIHEIQNNLIHEEELGHNERDDKINEYGHDNVIEPVKPGDSYDNNDQDDNKEVAGRDINNEDNNNLDDLLGLNNSDRRTEKFVSKKELFKFV
jgi:hypothetical protein